MTIRLERFLSYLVAALQEADHTIGSEAAQLLAASQQAPPEAVLTSLINDLDSASREIVLVLDDYQFISSQAVHEEVAFLLEHCPNTLHLVIATRSDPPLPLARLRARGQTVELRAADLRFTEAEAAQFLNDVMGLRLDAGSVAAARRTYGRLDCRLADGSSLHARSGRCTRVYRRVLRHEPLHSGLPAGGGPGQPTARNPAFSSVYIDFGAPDSSTLRCDPGRFENGEWRAGDESRLASSQFIRIYPGVPGTGKSLSGAPG